MLKIKDNVDLKELEKFGFEGCIDGSYILKKERAITWEYIVKKSKKIYMDSFNLDILFDLIQAGLVEKVEEQ